MNFPRASGILLHPTSLPGEYGIGDLGPEAYSFVNFLEEAGQTYWQILPLGPTGYGDSPYQCFSAFAGNKLLISPEMMVRDGWLTADQIAERPAFPPDKVDFGAVYKWKSKMLPEAYRRFKGDANSGLRADIDAFMHENAWWLDDYALYKAIKGAEGQKAWYDWPAPLKLREPGAMAAIAEQLVEETMAEKFYQFVFFRQWGLLKEYANKHGVRIIGDIPIFVALDSTDVWCNQAMFKLDADGSPKVIAGVPPDYFSATGQLWGNPIYDWAAMQADGFSWWTARLEYTLRTVDIVRIDHFRGFAAAWEVPGGDTAAENGSWVDVPGQELFEALIGRLGPLPVIAEDLGVITPDVVELRDLFGFPGMRILQFAFGGDAGNHDLPHNYTQNSAAYTGTHDNDTTAGWWQSQAGPGSTREAGDIAHERKYCMKYLDTAGSEIHWDFLRAVWASVADTAIAPAQDLLGLGSEARMNLPASESGNWTWRLRPDAITPEITLRLKELTDIYGRTSRDA